MKKEKIYDLLIYILIFFAIISTILLNKIDNLDEIWNYNFASNISKGLIPYKDFNIVVTPFLSIICGLILKITCNQLIIMRILAALLCSAIIFVAYKIFLILNIKKEVSIIFTFFIGYILKDIFCVDYNYASLLIALIIIYLEIEFYKKDNIFIKYDHKKDLLLGFLAGLAIITKQTTGIFIILVMLGNKLVFIREKEKYKINLNSCLFRLIGIAIPVICLVIYLLINNAFLDFINYTILGVREFNNVITYKTLLLNKNLVGFLAILVPIAIIYILMKTLVFEKDKKLYILFAYGLAIFVICFPISDEIHFLIGAIPLIIATLYEIYIMFKMIYNYNKIKLVKTIIQFILIALNSIVILFLIYYSVLNLSVYFEIKESFSTLNHFKYIPIDSDLQNNIKIVGKFIEENENVKILEASAAIYMIPLDKYSKDYDMLNKGNLGSGGEDRIIQEIADANNTKYLVLKDRYILNWQAPMAVINFAKENKKQTGTIEKYDIYE